MNKPITVEQLKRIVDEEVRNGNGDKVIMISDDDEGNGYHYLWYAMATAQEVLGGWNEDCINDRIATIENTMVLG